MSGLQIYNDGGTLQFDTESPAYAFVGKGSVTTTDLSDPSKPLSAYSIAAADNLPTFDTIAYSCRTSPVQGGTIGLPETNAFTVYAGPGSNVVTYYLFRSFGKFPSVSGAGLEYYTADGKLAYSSVYRPLAIVAKTQVNQRAGMNDFYSLRAGREYAYIKYGNLNRDMGNYGQSNGDLGGFVLNGANAGVRSADNGFYVQEILGAGIYWQNPINGGVLAADVTGL